MSERGEIVFLRPGLGIGGGERWCIDAARVLAGSGRRVRRVIGEEDTRRFADANDGLAPPETPLPLAPVHSDRLRTLRSILRLRRVARAFAATGARPEAIVLDQLPHVAPYLRRLWPKVRVLMYCHFPDGLIARRGGGAARFFYRRWVDGLEARGLAACHAVAANSAFTARAVSDFTGGRVRAEVVHPGVAMPVTAPRWPEPGPFSVFTLGRFDPDKRLDFSLEAWAKLEERLPATAFAACRLTLAGGCDPRRPVSREVRASLEARIARQGWGERVRLAAEPTPAEIEAGFAGAHCLLHPMPGEHFGLVPVEAMARGRPVLAVAGAGPDETVLDGRSGALRPFDAAAFGDVLAEWAGDPVRVRTLGEAARERAGEFSLEAFAERWVRWVEAAGRRRA